MNTSRLYRKHITNLPRQKRTIKKWGALAYKNGMPSTDESDKLYKCWNCGFSCNELFPNVRLGDGPGFYVTNKCSQAGGKNIGYSTWMKYPGKSPERSVNIDIKTVSTKYLITKGMEWRYLPATMQGGYSPIDHNLTQVVTSGCPMCGCRNYR
jgi:hypothetical protein